MTDKDKVEFIDIITLLADGLDQDLSERKIAFYYGALSDLSIQQVRAAADHISKVATFFPKPVDFRKFVTGDIEERAMAAWMKALKARDTYSSVIFDDLTIHGVIQSMGGWVKFCTMQDYDTEKWQMTDFVKIYKAIAMGSKREFPVKLVGQVELDRGGNGYEIPEPKLIGDLDVIENNLKQIEGGDNEA